MWQSLLKALDWRILQLREHLPQPDELYRCSRNRRLRGLAAIQEIERLRRDVLPRAEAEAKAESIWRNMSGPALWSNFHDPN